MLMLCDQLLIRILRNKSKSLTKSQNNNISPDNSLSYRVRPGKHYKAEAADWNKLVADLEYYKQQVSELNKG